MKKQFIIVLSAILHGLTCLSQSSWQYYNETSGLSYNNVSCITDDKFNNVWFGLSSGTSNGRGLDKFDGTTWTNYDTINSDLADNRVWNLISDYNGVLWISYLYDEGLTSFDGNTWTHYNTQNSGILSNFIGDLFVDERNNLWILCPEGISKFDGQTFTNYLITFHPDFSASAFVVEDSTSVWIATRGLMHYNPMTDSIILYDETNSNIPSLYNSCIGQDSSGLLWLGFNFGYNGGLGTGGTNGGLATFNGSTFSTVWPFYSTHTGVYDLDIDANNNIWVSTRCEGLYKYDGVSWVQIAEIPSATCSYTVFIDRQNYVWYSSRTSYYSTSGFWTNNLTIGIPEQASNETINIFPNPSANKMTINSGQNFIIKYSIFSTIGVEVNREENLHLNELNLSIDSFANGIYFLRVETEDGKSFVKRVIKN